MHRYYIGAFKYHCYKLDKTVHPNSIDPLCPLEDAPPNMEIQADAEGGALDSDIRLPKDISDFRYHNNKRR